MSVMIQLPAALSPMPAASKAFSRRGLVARIAGLTGIAGVARAAVARALMPSYAERHVKDVDILSVSRPHGYGRDSLGWNDIGYRV